MFGEGSQLGRWTFGIADALFDKRACRHERPAWFFKIKLNTLNEGASGFRAEGTDGGYEEAEL